MSLSIEIPHPSFPLAITQLHIIFVVVVTTSTIATLTIHITAPHHTPQRHYRISPRSPIRTHLRLLLLPLPKRIRSPTFTPMIYHRGHNSLPSLLVHHHH